MAADDRSDNDSSRSPSPLQRPDRKRESSDTRRNNHLGKHRRSMSNDNKDEDRMSDNDRRDRSRSRSPAGGGNERRSRSPRSRSRSRHRSRSRSRSRDRRRRYSDRSRSRSRDRRRAPSPEEEDDGYRLHVADISSNTTKRDLERVFGKYGPMKEIWMAHSTPCFAFAVYRYKEDAEEACRMTDGMELLSRRIRVTFALPRSRQRRRGFHSDMKCYQCGERGHFSRDCSDTKYGYKRPSSPGRRSSRY